MKKSMLLLAVFALFANLMGSDNQVTINDAESNSIRVKKYQIENNENGFIKRVVFGLYSPKNLIEAINNIDPTSFKLFLDSHDNLSQEYKEDLLVQLEIVKKEFKSARRLDGRIINLIIWIVRFNVWWPLAIVGLIPVINVISGDIFLTNILTAPTIRSCKKVFLPAKQLRHLEYMKNLVLKKLLNLCKKIN